MRDEKDTSVGVDTISKQNAAFRTVATAYFERNPVILGGPGAEVQVDETVIGKRKYNVGTLNQGGVKTIKTLKQFLKLNIKDSCLKKLVQKGRLTVDQQNRERKKHTWIFGAKEIGTNKVLLKRVEGKSKKDLIPLIVRHIAAGSTIVSDEMRTYKCSKKDRRYRHFSVNHKKNFVNPRSGKHTQAIESQWSKFKRRYVKRSCGIARTHLDSYLDLYMWRELFAGEDILYYFWSQVSEIYECE